MNILRLISEYWDIILAAVAIVSALIAKYIKCESSASKSRLFELITNAEKKYGSGTGFLKKACVVAEFSQSLSVFLKTFWGESKISRMVEDTLEYAKAVWDENGELRNYINENKG
ncbi:MAG: hypothetical protein GX824_00615 [Clostridiales bacterium]|jgi:hypothetical protein|nr:hypothetical protein [Clostridiales bacterium]